MTEEQISLCKTCLNRKKGDFAPEEICNIRGNVLAETETCNYFDLDRNVITNKDQVEDMVRPNSERAKLAVIMVGAVMVMNLIALLSSYMQLELLQQLKAGVFLADDVLNSNDTRERLVGIIFIVVSITSAVFFIQWFRRAYYNLHIRTGNCENSEGWAAGAWFVPFVCLYRPYHIMLELWNKTTDLVEEKNKAEGTEGNTTHRFSAQLVGTWWTLWILSNVIGRVMLKKAFDNATIDNLISSTQFSMVDSVFSLVLGVVTILMIREYAKREAVING
jgi:hypothetical protein